MTENTKLAQSMAYVAYQLFFNEGIGKEDIISTKMDELTYEILTKAGHNAIHKIWSMNLTLSTRHQNELFLTSWSHPSTFEPLGGGLSLNHFFSEDPSPDPDAELVCMGCDRDVDICYPYSCSYPEDDEYQDWKCEPGIVKSTKCSGIRFYGKRLYCAYDLIHNKPEPNPCQDCENYFEWIKRQRNSYDY